MTTLDADDLAAISALLEAALPGDGRSAWDYTLLDGDDAPIENALVWVSSDEAGHCILASAVTDASGVATLYLRPGTVYVWRRKVGWSFTNPDEEEVT